MVAQGTLPGQRAVRAPLAQLPGRVAEAEVKPPAITVVGPVAGLDLGWLEQRPLHGARVAVTRARAQASALAERLQALGAEVLETPAIRIVPNPPPPELADVEGYSLVCLTSPNGAHLLFEGLEANGKDARSLAGAVVAAIGPGTAAALAEHGLKADVVPPRSIAESLVEALEQVEVSGKRVMVARAAEARDVLPDALRERGAEVDVVALYETVAEPLGEDERAKLAAATHVTFTASSTVRFLMEAVDGDFPSGPRVVSIGPVTSATAREHGLTVDIEATEHDLDGLVEALLAGR